MIFFNFHPIFHLDSTPSLLLLYQINFGILNCLYKEAFDLNYLITLLLDLFKSQTFLLNNESIYFNMNVLFHFLYLYLFHNSDST